MFSTIKPEPGFQCKQSILAIMVILLSLGLSACSSSNSDEENDAPESASNLKSLLDAGTEPYELLSIGQSTEIKSNIQVSSEQILNIGESTETDAVTANFDVRTSLSIADVDAQISMIPVLKDYSAASFDTSESIPGNWQRIYSLKGGLEDASTNDDDGLIGYNTQHLFSFPGLILAVPDTAVGKGARWQYTLEVATGKVQTEVKLEELGNEILTVSTVSVYMPDDSASTVSYRNTLQATYDKTSLLIRSGTANLEVSQTLSVSINGQPVNYRATDRLVHTISRVAQ